MAVAAEEAVAETARCAAQTPVDKEKAMPSQITLKDAGLKFFEGLQATAKNQRTVATYKREFEVVTGFFGDDKNVAAIRPADVGRFLKSDALLKKPSGTERAGPTIKQIVRVLRVFLEWAQAQGLVETVALPKDAMPNRKRLSACGHLPASAGQAGAQAGKQQEDSADAAESGN